MLWENITWKARRSHIEWFNYILGLKDITFGTAHCPRFTWHTWHFTWCNLHNGQCPCVTCSWLINCCHKNLDSIMFRYQIESIWTLLERYASVMIRYNARFCCAGNESSDSTIKTDNTFSEKSKFLHVPICGTSNQ